MTGYPRIAPALKIARAILAAALPDAYVASKMPNNYSDVMVIVSRAGGRRPNLVTDQARILIEVWVRINDTETTVQIAEDTTSQAMAALENAQGTTVEGAFVRGFDNIEGPVDFPDPDVSSLERWQFQGDLLVSTS